jgi:hypothetical protein
MYVPARQLSRAPSQHRKRSPDLAFKVEYTMQEVVEESADRTVQVSLLTASVAMFPHKLRAATEACRFMTMPSRI